MTFRQLSEGAPVGHQTIHRRAQREGWTRRVPMSAIIRDAHEEADRILEGADVIIPAGRAAPPRRLPPPEIEDASAVFTPPPSPSRDDLDLAISDASEAAEPMGDKDATEGGDKGDSVDGQATGAPESGVSRTVRQRAELLARHRQEFGLVREIISRATGKMLDKTLAPAERTPPTFDEMRTAKEAAMALKIMHDAERKAYGINLIDADPDLPSGYNIQRGS